MCWTENHIFYTVRFRDTAEVRQLRTSVFMADIHTK
nr:MAG TPA: hypothetical protein [Bacteriophage sp.]